MRASLIFLSVIPAVAQFSGLASTDDGSQLYFSSPLQLAGTTNENTSSKIFRYDSTGIHFVAQMAKVATAGGYLLPTSNPYNLTSAYVSGNGSVFGYVGTADCPSGPCYYQGVQQTTLQFSGSFSPYVLPYGCQVSKNARYACLTGGRAVSEYFAVFDLFGTGKPIYGPACGQITSAGDTYCGAELFSLSGSTTSLSLPATVVPEIPISDDASTIAYVVDMVSNGGASPGYSLYIENISSGAQSLVYTDKQSRMLSPLALSNNGGVVLFELYSAGAIAQAAVVHADGTGFLQLTNDSTGVVSVLAINEIFSQDFGGNSPSNPAPPGGFVNLYLTGLGPVATLETDGVPAQASPLPEVVTPLSVAAQVTSTTTMALNVAYAGLAPGFVGVYQLTVQIPSLVPHNPFFQLGTPNDLSLSVNSTAIAVPVWVTSNQ